MIFKVMKSAASFRSSFFYNINKVERGEAEIIGVRNFENDKIGTLYRTLLERESHAVRTVNKSAHFTLSPDKNYGEELTDEQALNLVDCCLAANGFANQPYFVVRHDDTEKTHYHVVSTKILENGRRVKWNQIGRRLTHELMKHQLEYNYVAGRELKWRESRSGAKLINAFFDYVEKGGFRSCEELMAELKVKRIEMTVSTSKHQYAKTYVTLRRIDSNGHRTGRPAFLTPNESAYVDMKIKENNDSVAPFGRYVIHNEMAATLFIQSKPKIDDEYLYEATRFALRQKTWGAEISFDGQNKLSSMLRSCADLGYVTVDARKAIKIGNRLANPDEVITFTSVSGKKVSMPVGEEWEEMVEKDKQFALQIEKRRNAQSHDELEERKEKPVRKKKTHLMHL